MTTVPPPIDILRDAVRHATQPTASFGRLFTDHAREIVYRETGLPPCDEVTLKIVEDPLRKAYELRMSFPSERPGDETFVKLNISQLEWNMVGSSVNQQLHAFELAIVKIAHQWMQM